MHRVVYLPTFLDRNSDSISEDTTGGGIDEIRRPRKITSTHPSLPWQKSSVLVNLAGHYQPNYKVKLTARLENTFDEEHEEIFGYHSLGCAA